MTPNWFVAWPVSGPMNWLTALEESAPGGLHFYAPADLHLTLAFLGRSNEALIQKLLSLLKGLPIREIEISLDRIIALPQPRRFSALAFTLSRGRKDVEEQMLRWRDRICREAGARLETRPPLPHITIARPDRRIGADDRAAALDWIEQAPDLSPISLRLESPRLYTWNAEDADRRFRFVD